MALTLEQLDQLIAAVTEPRLIVLPPADWYALDAAEADGTGRLERRQGGLVYRGLDVVVGDGPRVLAAAEAAEWNF